MLSYRGKILADRTIGLVVSIFTAVLARIAGFFLKRNHDPAMHPKALAVAKFVGIGSIVYVGHFCRLLRRRFPEARIYFITTKGFKTMAERLPDVDEVLIVNDTGLGRMIMTNISLIFKLWAIRPELYFDMEVYSSYSAVIANLSLARNRYGFYRKSVAFKKGLFTHLVFFNTRRHISEIYRQMAIAAGADNEGGILTAPILYPEDDDQLLAVLERYGINQKPVVLINPNASELLLERRWLVERWVAYLDQAVRRWSHMFFLIVGTSDEVTYVDLIYERLSEKTKENVVNLAGQLEFGAFLSLLKRARLVVTVDSGPLHLAAAFGKPTISLWGPVAPEHYAPIGGRHKTLYNPTYCSPCLYHADVPPCGGDNQCMKNIFVEELIEATGEFFQADTW